MNDNQPEPESPEVLPSEDDDGEPRDEAQRIRTGVRQMVAYMVKDKEDDAKPETELQPLPPASEQQIVKLRKRVEQYFEDCDNAKIPVTVMHKREAVEIFKPRPYTLAGLTLSLGLTSHDQLKQLRKTPGFTEVLGWALLKMEQQRSEDLVTRTTNPVGLIFDLKNTFKWTDQPSRKRIGVEITLEEALDEIAGKSRGLPKDKMPMTQERIGGRKKVSKGFLLKGVKNK